MLCNSNPYLLFDKLILKISKKIQKLVVNSNKDRTKQNSLFNLRSYVNTNASFMTNTLDNERAMFELVVIMHVNFVLCVRAKCITEQSKLFTQPDYYETYVCTDNSSK